MVNLKLTIPDYVKEEDVIRTIFKVSSNSDMSSPILDTTLEKGSVTNILELTSSVELADGNTYYATVSYITEVGGLSFTSDIKQFVSNDTIDVELEVYLPSKVPVPKLTSVYPVESFPSQGFNISMDVFEVLLNKHYATTWLLVRLVDNIIIESSILDTKNVNTKFFGSKLLPGVYEVRARRHMVSGNDSIFSSFIFTVRDPVNIKDKFGLEIDIINTVYAQLELDKVSVISDTDDLGMRTFSNGIEVDSQDIDSGLTDVTIYTNATVQIYIKGKEESSLYLYSLYRYPGSCRFEYTLPIDFC